MFEITTDDISRLDDDKLRNVVARLCEAELRQRGMSASYVTWGAVIKMLKMVELMSVWHYHPAP